MFRRHALAVLKRIFSVLSLIGLATGSLCVTAGQPAELRVLTWPGYADHDIVEKFEHDFGIEVSVTYITSDDDLWNKISFNNSADFDLFAVNTAELQRYLKKGLVAPIDPKKIPNINAQLPRFRDLKQLDTIFIAGNQYAVPYTYSEMGIIYSKDAMAEPPKSIKSLWDRRYEGRVLAYDASNHNFSLAAQTLGFSNPFTMSSEQLVMAAKKLVDLRRNILTFYSDPDEALRIYRDSGAVLMFANYGAQQVRKMKEAGLNIGYVIPEEGAFAWLDCWVISKSSKNALAAHDWINYMLTKDVGQALTKRQGLMNTIEQPLGQDSRDKIIWLEELLKPEERADLWLRVRAGDAPESFK